MIFKIFSLHPEIFESFLSTSLIARGISGDIINVEIINWREKYGVGGYRQVDDRPFGGGSGMVLMLEPIVNALRDYEAISSLVPSQTLAAETKIFDRVLPPNVDFFDLFSTGKVAPRVTISLTPRGFPINQEICEWLAGNFQQINLLCGRYEGFDSRISNFVDLELSLGSFVTNGGEVPSMALVEAVSRLIPGFITKDTSVLHDSFSSELNTYLEQREFVIGKKNLAKNLGLDTSRTFLPKSNLFDNGWWAREILPHIEHPQFTRPEVASSLAVPPLLIEGNHKKIQAWRQNWYKNQD